MSDYRKPDSWTLRALKEGYPARSVYKLQEMDERFKLLPKKISRDFRVLDIGAAPGSWSLYILRKLKGRGLLAAVDLSPLSREYDRGLFDGENFFFLQGDIYKEEVQKALLSRGPYDLIVSDIAPATSGNKSVDSLRSLALVEAVVEIADKVLKTGGTLAVKIFQGGESANILKDMRAKYERAQSFKPAACRKESFETYYLGFGKKS